MLEFFLSRNLELLPSLVVRPLFKLVILLKYNFTWLKQLFSAVCFFVRQCFHNRVHWRVAADHRVCMWTLLVVISDFTAVNRCHAGWRSFTQPPETVVSSALPVCSAVETLSDEIKTIKTAGKSRQIMTSLAFRIVGNWSLWLNGDKQRLGAKCWQNQVRCNRIKVPTTHQSRSDTE